VYNWSSIKDIKLTPGLKGPFIIERPVGEVWYRITRAGSLNKNMPRIVHVQSLKPVLNRPNLDDPGEVKFNNNNQESAFPMPTLDTQESTTIPVLNTQENTTSILPFNTQKNNENQPSRHRRPPTWLKDYIV